MKKILFYLLVVVLITIVIVLFFGRINSQKPSDEVRKFLPYVGKIWIHGCENNKQLIQTGVTVGSGSFAINNGIDEFPSCGSGYTETMGSASYFVVNNILYTAKHVAYESNGEIAIYFQSKNENISIIGNDIVQIRNSNFLKGVKQFTKLGTYRLNERIRIIGIKNIGTTGKFTFMEEESTKVVKYMEGGKIIKGKFALIVPTRYPPEYYIGFSGTPVLNEDGFPIGIFTGVTISQYNEFMLTFESII